MKIKDIEIKHGIFLGPMAGVSDMPYRVLCNREGAEVTYTEMVSAKAIYYNNKKTEQLMAIDEEEQLVGVQLFGNEPELIGEMIQKIDNKDIAIFDINMGCPVPKIVNNGEGSALMKNPKLVQQIVRAMVQATKKPITVKIRKGFDDQQVNAVEIAKIAEQEGASMVTVHGRTREQYYSGKADWKIIREVKEALHIPVVGNGDVFTAKDAKAMKEITGCDGIMVSRGAMGNPFIFRELIAMYEGVDYKKPTHDEITSLIMEHARRLIAHKGEYIGVREMRKHVSWYTKGMENAAKVRNEINAIESLEEVEYLLREKLLR